MSDRKIIFPELKQGHINLLARRYGAFTRRSILDVGCGDGVWVQQLRRRGALISGLDDQQQGSDQEGVIHRGSPAASIPFAAQSCDVVLIRGTALFRHPEGNPEITIALANLLSCLKPKGRLVIPVSGPEDPATDLWKRRLDPFPVRDRMKTWSGGLIAWLTLASLFGRDHRVTVQEFVIGRKPISRLEWHRLARKAVLSAMQSPPAAA